jgi:hypothetical protein
LAQVQAAPQVHSAPQRQPARRTAGAFWQPQPQVVPVHGSQAQCETGAGVFGVIVVLLMSSLTLCQRSSG